MKRILITGADSYVGTSVENYLKQRPEEYEIATVDMKDEAWKSVDFSGFDTVYHVAGIAHSDVGNVTDEGIEMYYRINADLAIETAEKAKAEGVGQFIFMSSAIVYGDSAPIGKSKMITAETPVSPANFYGDSKVKAEEGLMPLNEPGFKVVILRPPMIYGRGSKGNYPTLAKMARKLPIFPKVKNERSMLYIENLAEFVRLMIENEESGIFWPQNNEYSNTSELVGLIAENHGKKILRIAGVTWILKILSHMTGLVNKAFGNLTYDMAMSEYKTDYRVCDLRTSIERTEKE